MATTLDLGGARIFYEDVGDGAPVLVIHGAAASGRWFDEFLPILAATHRVVVPDLRGLGRSGRIRALDTPRVWVDDMWATLDDAGVGRVDIIGVSLGSRIAGRLALERPDRVRSLAVDAPIVGISAHGNTTLNSVFTEVDENSDQAREWLRLHGEDWRDAVAFYARARSSDGFQDYYTLRELLADIATPTLIMRGDFDDQVHPIADAVHWHAQAPQSELFIAPGLSQSSVILERPAEAAAAFERFVERVSRTQSA